MEKSLGVDGIFVVVGGVVLGNDYCLVVNWLICSILCWCWWWCV